MPEATDTIGVNRTVRVTIPPMEALVFGKNGSCFIHSNSYKYKYKRNFKFRVLQLKSCSHNLKLNQ